MSCVEREKETAYVPKNVKQIGEPSRERKIYVEDYVITYINRIFMGNRETEKVLLLFGGDAVEKGCNYIYIRGACQVKAEGSEKRGKYFSGEDFQNAMEEGRKFFKNLPLIGWALIRKGQPMNLDERMRNTWEAYMSRIPIFLLGDAEEKEEIFYWKYDGRIKVQPGYYVFYEKNRAMQEYMIEKKDEGKQVGEKKKEEDFLVDSLRERLEERKAQDRRQTGKMIYAVSGFLFLVVLAIGVTLLNSNEKIAAIQTSVDSLLESLAESETRQLEVKRERVTVDAISQEREQDTTAATVPREIATTESSSSTTSATESSTTTTSTTESSTTTASATTESAAESTAASTEEVTEAVNKKPVSHIVGKGETLESISRSVYGTASMVNEICKKNNITNPDAIFVGQEILLP